MRLYTIVTENDGVTFNRAKAMDRYVKAQAVAKVTGEYVRITKPLNGFHYPPVDSALQTAREMRAFFNNEMGRQYNIRKFLQRSFWGRKISVEIYSGMESKSFAVELKNSLLDMKLKVKRLRRDAYSSQDRLKERPTGYYLKKYQDRALKRDKRPTSDAQFTGIEIECVMPQTADFGVLLPFAKWINVGHDGSIHHESGEEGREVRVCIERSEVRKVIPPLMQALRSIGAFVNKSCGLHVHLDRRNDPQPELSFQKLVRSLGLLYTVVPKSRRKNQYCKRNRHADWNVARGADRYKAINATSYDKYKTIEVRLFGGTLEEDKIMNWIDTLWAIVDGQMIGRVPKNFDTALKYWNLSEETVKWLKARQERFAPLNELAPMAESETEENQALLEERREAEREARRQDEEYCEICDVYNDHDTQDCESDLAEAA